ncbi:ABC transporter, partial [Coprococcus catus]
LHRPKILILDEPTTGLDPQTRNTLWSVISDLRKNEKMTVFLTTHYMEEAADADYVIILDNGKIVAKGTPLELKNLYTGDFITIYGAKEEEIKMLGAKYEAIRDAYRVSVPNTAAATQLILRYPEIFKDYEITKGKMDDVFLTVTGKKLAGGV